MQRQTTRATAYIASRNRPSVDKQLFENSSGARRGAGGGRRRGGQQSQDRQAEAARAAALKGPHSFTLQRLLAVYRALRRAADPAGGYGGGGGAGGSGDFAAPAGAGASAAAAAAATLFGGGVSAAAAAANGGAGAGDDDGGDCALDVDGAPLLAAVAGLVGRRLLAAAGGEDALGAPRYAIEVPAAVAEAVAMELRINLAAYLRYV